jgi:hypothetical protein
MTVEHLEVLVEERSMEETLRILLPRLLGDDISFQIYPSNGKQDFLDNLANRLRGYQKWLPEDWRIAVVVDRDDDDCEDLKRTLEKTANDAGLFTKTSSKGDDWQVVNRLAIEELEAWFFGDLDAVRVVFPRVSDTTEKTAAYRDPDAIQGGTWEALERVLQRSGYFKGGYRKLEAAREIAQHMNPSRNRSHSFCIFRDTLRSLQGD